MSKFIKQSDYFTLVDKATPTVNFVKTGTMAFLIGGTICGFGEILRLFCLKLKLNDETSSIIVASILITATAFLTGFGVFHKIAKFGGAGTFVPITGFANSVVSPALEFKTEGFVLGVCSKMFIIAGPVVVFGVVSAMIVGIIYKLFLCFGVV